MSHGTYTCLISLFSRIAGKSIVLPWAMHIITIFYNRDGVCCVAHFNFIHIWPKAYKGRVGTSFVWLTWHEKHRYIKPEPSYASWRRKCSTTLHHAQCLRYRWNVLGMSSQNTPLPQITANVWPKKGKNVFEIIHLLIFQHTVHAETSHTFEPHSKIWSPNAGSTYQLR